MAKKGIPPAIKKKIANKKPRKTGGRVPPALAKWQKAHPNAKNAHKGGK